MDFYKLGNNYIDDKNFLADFYLSIGNLGVASAFAVIGFCDVYINQLDLVSASDGYTCAELDSLHGILSDIYQVGRDYASYSLMSDLPVNIRPYKPFHRPIGCCNRCEYNKINSCKGECRQ